MSPKNPDRIDAAVGQNIRIQRLAKGMSQSDLAAQLGVSFQQLQKYEKGSNRVGSSRLHRIAQAFGLPVTALYEGIGDARRQRSAASSGLQLIADRQAFRLVSAFAQIKDRTARRSIVTLVERVARVPPRTRRTRTAR